MKLRRRRIKDWPDRESNHNYSISADSAGHTALAVEGYRLLDMARGICGTPEYNQISECAQVGGVPKYGLTKKDKWTARKRAI
ncbi:MAG: hypothetical protein KIY11_09760 [Thermoplasmata archaeon]|nr:hypothetical protein [Candidatus Sysuiplasma acidicola]MBX8638622.1 hypothetical protein [Candidatus Sysuiplasma acidicola]